MTKNRTLNPGIYNRPDHVLIVLNFFFLNVLSFLRFGKNFAYSFPIHQLFFYQYARLLVSFIGSLIPVLAYLIGKELNARLGLIMSLVFAFFPSFILHSLYVTPDIPITLFTLIIIFFTIKFLNTRRNEFLYFAILFSAINTAEKYPGVISLTIPIIGILIMHLETKKNWSKIDWWYLTRTIIKISIIYLFALFLVGPNIFLHYRLVIDALIIESRSTHLGADNLGFFGNLSYYLKTFGSWTNWISTILIGGGLYVLIRNKIKYDSTEKTIGQY